MTDSSTEPRIHPIPPEERVGDVRELLDTATVAGPDANIFTTFARAPGLFRRWLPFGGKLLNGKIPARERELLILRTGWNCRAEYEWAQHVRIGLAIDAPESTGFFDSLQVLMIGETNDLTAEFSSDAIRARSRLRIVPELPFSHAR